MKRDIQSPPPSVNLSPSPPPPTYNLGESWPQSTQSGNGNFLAYISSWWKNQPKLVRVGVHAHPLSLNLPSHTKLWLMLQLRGQIHFPCFYSTPICTLWFWSTFQTRSFYVWGSIWKGSDVLPVIGSNSRQDGFTSVFTYCFSMGTFWRTFIPS